MWAWTHKPLHLGKHLSTLTDSVVHCAAAHGFGRSRFGPLTVRALPRRHHSSLYSHAVRQTPTAALTSRTSLSSPFPATLTSRPLQQLFPRPLSSLTPQPRPTPSVSFTPSRSSSAPLPPRTAPILTGGVRIFTSQASQDGVVLCVATKRKTVHRVHFTRGRRGGSDGGVLSALVPSPEHTTLYRLPRSGEVTAMCAHWVANDVVAIGSNNGVLEGCRAGEAGDEFTSFAYSEASGFTRFLSGLVGSVEIPAMLAIEGLESGREGEDGHLVAVHTDGTVRVWAAQGATLVASCKLDIDDVTRVEAHAMGPSKVVLHVHPDGCDGGDGGDGGVGGGRGGGGGDGGAAAVWSRFDVIVRAEQGAEVEVSAAFVGRQHQQGGGGGDAAEGEMKGEGGQGSTDIAGCVVTYCSTEGGSVEPAALWRFWCDKPTRVLRQDAGISADEMVVPLLRTTPITRLAKGQLHTDVRCLVATDMEAVSSLMGSHSLQSFSDEVNAFDIDMYVDAYSASDNDPGGGMNGMGQRGSDEGDKLLADAVARWFLPRLFFPGRFSRYAMLQALHHCFAREIAHEGLLGASPQDGRDRARTVQDMQDIVAQVSVG